VRRRLVGELGLDSWGSAAVSINYQRAHGLRAVGEGPDGFTVSASKTVAVPVDRLYDAVVDGSLRERWLPGAELRERTATQPKSARFDWSDGNSRVNVFFAAKGEARSTATIQHERLPSGEDAERMKAYWRARVTDLKEVLERA
jgi:uncharacterized protein YndB with AHSA1/START domain